MRLNCEKEIYVFINQLQSQQLGINQLIKQDLYIIFQDSILKGRYRCSLLNIILNIDKSIFTEILQVRKKRENPRHTWIFLIEKQQKIYQSLKNKLISKITNLLRNIQEHPFSKINYSVVSNDKVRGDLVKKKLENQKIIDFLKFLVHLTSIDDRFVQCGSNSLNLLVEMKPIQVIKVGKTLEQRKHFQQVEVLQDATLMEQNLMVQMQVE
ncbi:unnamed protein product [Paramecium sonneborni]|uniref:Uncharacterized protein n=1 Tax=Paramecium sonneborni TaxID=65129 RepID=A0A8S1RUT7_9CILI|nr:unnamed protein product [Paramecium sonneborni]